MKMPDIIIIGAGAAGLMCAIEAGRRGRKVLILDSARRAAEKIRISGGGRCNFTNIHSSPQNYISQNPSFCTSALSRYSAADFIALVKKHQIAFHEKTLGQLFCDVSAQQIIDMLLSECRAVGVEILLNTEVKAINRSENFCVESSMGKFTAQSLVVACGGLSIPKMGASGLGYDIARQFGLKIVQTHPALVPFTMLNHDVQLSGIAVDAIVSYQKQTFKEAILFTHRGLSGPAILQISSYWQSGTAVNINLAPQLEVEKILLAAKLNHPRQEPASIIAQILPKNLAKYIIAQQNITGKLADQSHKKIHQLGDAINNWQPIPSGTEGYRTAEVTRGGVDTNELSSKTMESKKVPGLFFIGEVVDVTGHLGGFNFQWAWSSGHAAGQFA